MTDATTCPDCGCTITPDMPDGLCPACLVKVGMHAPGSPWVGATSSRPGSGPMRFQPPSLEALAGSFPQLEIIELLGIGGMGAVYKARQKKLDRWVALKVIPPEAAEDPAFAERFAREARALARLNHPHIVAIHDFGEIEQTSQQGTSQPLFYFVMEYVDGANLRQVLHSGSLSAPEALAIVPQLCEALQYAHDEGVVHRDIKPENILLDQRGRVKIADFGLAKLAAVEEFTLTGTHQIMGTPHYMAPEQLERSRTVDHRADIYSLGVVLYEMLTGELPLGHFEPPSRKSVVDARLDQVVMRSLAKEPERRYQRISEFQTELQTASQVIDGSDQAMLPDNAQPAKTLKPPVAHAPAAKNGQREPGVIYAFELSHREFFTLGMMALSIISVVSTAIAWTQIHGVMRDTGEQATISISGFEYWLPTLAAGLSFLLCLYSMMMLVFGRQGGVFRGVLAASAGIACLTTSLGVLASVPLTVESDEFQRLVDRFQSSAYTTSPWSWRSSQVETWVSAQPGVYVTMCAGALLLMAGAFELRLCLGPTLANDRTAADQVVRGPAQGLRGITVVSMISVPLLILFNVLYQMRDNHWGMSKLQIVMMVCLFLQIAHAVIGVPLMLMGAGWLQSGYSTIWGRASAIFAALPLGISWVVGWPIAVWTWIAAQHPAVRQASAQRQIELETAKQQVRSCGAGMIVAGIVAIVFWIAIGMVLFANLPRPDADPMRTLLPVAIALGLGQGMLLLHAGLLTRRCQSHWWIRAGAWIGLLPFSPAWFVSLPVSCQTFSALKQRVSGKAQFWHLFAPTLL